MAARFALRHNPLALRHNPLALNHNPFGLSLSKPSYHGHTMASRSQTSTVSFCVCCSRHISA